MPLGAATTGNGAYFIAFITAWPVEIKSSIIGHSATLAANKASPTLAPTEKFSASLWITSAFIFLPT